MITVVIPYYQRSPGILRKALASVAAQRGCALPVHVIVVDDGLVTGATMHAAVRAIRQQSPFKLVVAVPVGAPDSCAQLRQEADALV